VRHALRLAGPIAAALLIVAPASSRTHTTNVPAIFTVKVTVTNTRIAMHPAHAVRGSTVTFILTNRGTKTRTFVIGDVKRGRGRGQGFAQILRPDQQFTKVMYLDYRGVMKFSTRAGRTVVATGLFTIR
jgi:hypothetical protein